MATPADTEFTAQWGYNRDVQTGVEMGTGKANTQRLKIALEQQGELTKAAHRCTQLNINGFTDWFLPSKGELSWMYINLKEKGLGDFGQGLYWSSSNSSGGALWNSAWSQRFSDGYQEGGYIHNMGNTYSVRAIQQF